MSCPTTPDIFEQLKELLLELSMAFEIFAEVNNKSFEDKSVPVLRATTAETDYRAYKFQRRRPTDSDSSSSSSGSSSGSSSAGARKRSWESDEQAPGEMITFEAQNFPGKRSKSLVLTQELEGLRLSNNLPSKYDSEINEWLDQDLNFKAPSWIDRFEDLKRELEGLGSNASLDDVLKVLGSYKNTSESSRNVLMTHWIKWGIINEVTESIKSSNLPVKTILNRSLNLLIALNRTFPLVDWNDPELPFLLNKFLITLLQCNKFKNVPTNSPSNCNKFTLTLNKKLEEFIGLLRVLNLFYRIPVPQMSFNFLLSRPETSAQIIQLLELIFETNLNIFELTAVLSTNFNIANISTLLSLKIVENYGNSQKEIKEITGKLKNRINQL